MSIQEKDIQCIRDAIQKNVPPHEQATATAMFNIGLHFLGLFERAVIAHEKIASK